MTWNYCPFYYQYLDADEGIKWLRGKRAGDTIDRLRAAVTALGTEHNDDYWKPTTGNAGYILSVLLAWAEQYPDAVFYVH